MTIAIETEDTVATYLPMLRGYVVNNYAWISRRGHCLLDLDDLLQISSILLMKIAAEWEARGEAIGGTDANRRRFFAYLKGAVKTELLTEMRDHRFNTETTSFDSLNAPATSDDGVENVATIAAYRSAHIPQAPEMLHGEAAEYFPYLPPMVKTMIALRYFDQLTMAQINALMGMRVEAKIGVEISRWRRHCLNLCTSEIVELPSRRTRPWTPTAELIEYLQDRYGTDLPGYLGFFTIALRVDAGYLVDILNPSKTYVPDSHRGRRAFTHLEERRIDDMLASGHTLQQVADAFGVATSTVFRHAHRS